MMSLELLNQLEQKVDHTIETIELLRLQIEELEEENTALKAEHEKWRHDLVDLISRFDEVDTTPYEKTNLPIEELEFE
jgi:cell division protein ZapB